MIIIDGIAVSNKFSHGDRICLVSDPDQEFRIVTGILINPGFTIVYQVSCGTVQSYHYECEMSGSRDLTRV